VSFIYLFVGIVLFYQSQANPGWKKRNAEPEALASAERWQKRSVDALPGGGWGKRSAEAAPGGGWGRRSAEAAPGGGWGKRSAEAAPGGGWGRRSAEAAPGGGWGKRSAEAAPGGGWGKRSAEAAPGGGWGKRSAEASPGGGWGKRSAEAAPGGGWGKRSAEAAPGGGWRILCIMNQAELQHLVSKLRVNVLHKKLPRHAHGPRGSLELIRTRVTALIANERIECAPYSAEITRLYTERLISDAILNGEKHAHTMEMATWWLAEDKSAIHKLFKVLVPRFQDSRKSYTQIWTVPVNYETTLQAPSRAWDGKLKVVELRGHPLPKLEYSNSQPNRNHIHNFLLSEAKRDFNLTAVAQAIADQELKESRALPSMKLLDLILEWIVTCCLPNDNCSKLQSLLEHLEDILKGVGKIVEVCLVPALATEAQSQDCLQMGPRLSQAFGRNCSMWQMTTPPAEFQHFLEAVSKEPPEEADTSSDLPLDIKLEVTDQDVNLDVNRVFTCDKCDRRYKNPSHFHAHLLKCNAQEIPTHWRRSGGKYFCAFQGCNHSQSWTTSTGVWKHIVKSHSSVQEQSPFTCYFCDKSYPNRTLVNEHMNRSHMKKFKCDICGRGFGDNTSRKSHMRIHLGEKPYQCDQCEYKSASSGGLTTHKKIMHDDNRRKEHCCDKCGKRFALKSNLKEHIRSHSSEKAFLCGVCGKALKNKQCLNRHLFTHGIKHTCE
ncbi:hypothetical protein TCAL_11766, partial [Tigriopus californicus]